MAQAIISRKDALATKQRFYFTGKPCKHGHTDARYTSTGQCSICVYEYSMRWGETNRALVSQRRRARRAADPAPARAAYRTWRENNKGQARENYRRWCAANKAARTEYRAQWRAENADRILAYDRARRQMFPGASAAKAMQRHAAKLQRTPLWADLSAIKEIYEMAAEMTAKTGEAWHVDHVLPLRGKLVSGLHVAENLQLLPGKENCRKSNTFNP